ncbi:Arylsulfatase precursor [Planctomycetes bacterium CA13]|uniref:Arylsulfatase n=1 Tax=Novipirellula herctigrandis TaxID=2527986 RepID=A0A5C5Z2W6_9BACT|nr:Arylsulfatase precursor [Planctomycetes bacterium CA13]
MRQFCCVSIWLSVVLFALAGQAAKAAKPNVVFILSDDQGWTDYGFMGHPYVQTPNLDALARSGLLYERGYVTAPLCRPSLASLVSGLYPHQTGIRGNDPLLPIGKSRRSQKDKPFSAKLRNRMTAPMMEHPSFIRTLKENGYATLQTGKWWEGNPLDHGFTDAMTHGDHFRGGRHGDDGLKIGRETMKPIYDFVDKANANDQPFFVWYGVFLPHAPHNAPDRLLDKYQDLAPDEPTARYWANVEWLDEGCGQMIDYLKKKQLYEDTIFVYTCDNGWVQDPGKLNNSIRSKREPVEAGIRTPIFITHGKTIQPQRDTEILASNIDIATTILRACGIKPPSAMTGLDLRDPTQLKKRNRVFVDVYEHDSDLDQLDDLGSGLMARVVIDGWDKLIARPERDELYDLKTDPDDRNDLASLKAEKVKKLSGILDAWVGNNTSVINSSPPRR